MISTLYYIILYILFYALVSDQNEFDKHIVYLGSRIGDFVVGGNLSLISNTKECEMQDYIFQHTYNENVHLGEEGSKYI